MNLQTVKPRARWKDSGYGPYCAVKFSDMPGEYVGRTVEEALRFAHLMRLTLMVSLKGGLNSGRRST
jgi:hypothetical protein